MIYISAPISGYDLKERKAYFARIARQLEIQGNIVFNPMADIDILNPPPYELCMKTDINALTRCNKILLCGDWPKPRGCRLEYEVARTCGLEIAVLVEQ